MNPGLVLLATLRAGTGKSTLVKYIVAALDIPSEKVVYITYTGKAAEVLREKGCPNAMTAHKLMYHSRQLPNGNFVYKPRSHISYSLIIVDEVSMLPKSMWNLLLTYGVPIITLGDPAQIPPISKDEDNHVLEHPHIFLDEVMRQAKESDIIRLSMDIREGKKISPFKGIDAQVFYAKDIIDGMYQWADQILVATNRNRAFINNHMRNAENCGEEPEIGDKIICLRNCWETSSIVEGNPLVNGTIGWIDSLEYDEIPYVVGGERITAPVLWADITTGADRFKNILIDYQSLKNGIKFFTPRQEYLARRSKKNPELPVEFNYGYAITTHRAQGSQWPKVLVVEENFPFDKDEHRRWLYTSVTRPSEKLTLILKG